jgi:hypothetical protein
MVERDFAYSKIDAICHPNTWRRRYHLRIVIMTIYEWKIAQAFDSEFYACLDRLDVPPELIGRFKAATKVFNKAKEQADKEFSWIRNNAIAHRNRDGLGVYKKITQLNEKRSIDLVSEVFVGVEAIMNVLTPLIVISGSLQSIVKQTAHEMRVKRNQETVSSDPL